MAQAAPTRSRTAPIFTRLVNFCWSLFQSCLLLAIVAAVAVGGYLYYRLDDEIRRQVERRLAGYYHDFDVRVGAARFDADRGIAISNLTITQKSPGSQPVLAVEEMYLAGNVRMDQLITGQMPIDDIVVRGAKLRLVRQSDGQWNAHGLLPLPHFGKSSPQVKIEDAAATIDDPTIGFTKPFTVGGVNLQLNPIKPAATGEPPSNRICFDGTTTGLPAKEVRVKGEFGTTDGTFDLSLTVTGLEISPETLADVPAGITGKLHGADISGRANVALTLSRPASNAAVDWTASIKVDRGRLSHPLLPEPLTDVTVQCRADPHRLFVEQLIGRLGSATVAAAIDRAGWAEKAPLGLSAKVVGLTIDGRYRPLLRERCVRIWDRFKPMGTVDAEVHLTFDGENWRPVLSADCRGISLTDADKFPYTLEQTTGRVEYRGTETGGTDHLHLDLTGFGGGRPVKIEAELTHVARRDTEDGVTTGTGVASWGGQQKNGAHATGYRGIGIARGPAVPHPLGFITISGTDIPIHEQLLAAIPEKAQALTRSLQPQGTIDFQFRSEWKELSQPRPDVTLAIGLQDCRIQFARFPYPLQHVHGLATANNWHWKLNDIEGRGVTDSTIIKCRGGAAPDGIGYSSDLTFDASDVPLDDALKNALTPAGQRAWDELRPQGHVDFTAHVTKQADRVVPEIAVVLQPHGNTVSIDPRMFPYRLEQVQGQAVYQRNHVELQNVAAQHDRTLYSAKSGTWDATQDGGWQLALKNLTADRLAMGRDLMVALPQGLRSLVERLQPNGTFGLFNSNLSFSKSPQFAGFASAWDVNLECQQASIQGAVPLRGITGGIHLMGRSDGHSAISAGELAIDSLLWNDLQLTKVHGPLWADSTHLLLGEQASRQQNQPSRRVTADAYGGNLAANIELLHDVNPSYKLDLGLGGVSLARFVHERLGGPNDMSGTVSGRLAVSGIGQTTQTLSGGGEMHLVDGNIYQLPPLVAMLKLLSNRPPNTTAFNRCDMKFTVQGEHVQFGQLNLLGDVVSLYGQGDADFNRKLNLVFYTLIGPADLPIPLWKTIAGHVSQQGLQIKVVGTLDDPKVEKEPFPAVKDILGRMKGELQDGAATMSPAAAARGSRVPPR